MMASAPAYASGEADGPAVPEDDSVDAVDGPVDGDGPAPWQAAVRRATTRALARAAVNGRVGMEVLLPLLTQDAGESGQGTT
jgi:hypothetical protein